MLMEAAMQAGGARRSTAGCHIEDSRRAMSEYRVIRSPAGSGLLRERKQPAGKRKLTKWRSLKKEIHDGVTLEVERKEKKSSRAGPRRMTPIKERAINAIHDTVASKKLWLGKT